MQLCGAELSAGSSLHLVERPCTPAMHRPQPHAPLPADSGRPSNLLCTQVHVWPPRPGAPARLLPAVLWLASGQGGRAAAAGGAGLRLTAGGLQLGLAAGAGGRRGRSCSAGHMAAPQHVSLSGAGIVQGLGLFTHSAQPPPQHSRAAACGPPLPACLQAQLTMDAFLTTRERFAKVRTVGFDAGWRLGNTFVRADSTGHHSQWASLQCSGSVLLLF